MSQTNEKVLPKEHLTLVGNMYIAHRKAIYRYLCNKTRNTVIAQDLTSEVFIKAMNFVFSGGYKDEGKHFQWLKKIAENIYIDHVRKTGKHHILRAFPGMPDPMEGIRNQSLTQEESTINSDILTQIETLLGLLSPEQQEVVRKRLQGKKFKVIAREKGLSINTVIGRMRDALRNLRRIADKHGIDLNGYKSG